MSQALFQTKTVKIDTLGEYLASVRKQLNLDIKTVALLAQIKPTYIELLEVGDYQTLPADVYIRGFLKSLATFYRIKEQLLIDQYEKERGFALLPAKMRMRDAGFSFTPKNLVIGTTILVSFGAILYVGNQIRSVLAPPYLNVSEPSADQSIEGNSIVIAGQGEIGAQVFINSQPVLTDENGHFTENLLLSAGLNVVEISEKNKFGKTSKVVRNITSNNTVIPTMETAAVNLTVNIGTGSAWVYLEADGIVVQRGTMLAGSSKIVSAKEQIILTSANAGSTQVIYNGKDLGKLGREGEVIRNVEFSSIEQ